MTIIQNVREKVKATKDMKVNNHVPINSKH